MKNSTYPQAVRSTRGSFGENGTISLGMKRAFSFMFCLLLAYIMQVNTATAQVTSGSVSNGEWCPNCTAEDIKVIGVDIVPKDPNVCHSETDFYAANFVFNLDVTAKQRYGLVIFFEMWNKAGTEMLGNYYVCTDNVFDKGPQSFPNANSGFAFEVPATDKDGHQILPGDIQIKNAFTGWDNQDWKNFCSRTSFLSAAQYDTKQVSGRTTSWGYNGTFSIADCKKIAPKCKSYLSVPVRLRYINPKITLGEPYPSLCESTTSASLSYTSVTQSANQYRIDYEDASISDVNWIALPASPISLSLPSSLAPGVYNATIYVRNSTTLCVGSETFTVTVNEKTSVSAITGCGGPYCIGDEVNLSVTADGSGSFSYQWYSSASNTNSGGTMIDGATNSSFSPSTEAAGTTYYYVVATGDCGSATSTAAGVTVRKSTEISDGPDDITYCEDAEVETGLSVTADGSNITYQWYMNSSASTTDATAITDATTSAYTPSSDVSGDFYYYVVVTGDCGTVTSDFAHVTVNAKPSIEEGPSGTSYCQGSETSDLTVEASGYDLSYVWYSYASERTDAVSVGTGSAISVSSDVLGTNYYYVVVTGGCGSVTSDDVSVVINETTEITSEPDGYDVCKDGVAKQLVVEATGSNLTYQWYSNSTMTTDGATPITDATNASYTPSVNAAGTMYYYVVVTTEHCGSVTSEIVKVQVTDCGSFCTYTQGYYGNDNGDGGMATYAYNGSTCTSTRVLASINNAIASWSGSIVLGSSARNNTIEIKTGDAANIRMYLPAGGTPAKISTTTDHQYQMANWASVPKNNLVAQTLTLALNIGLNLKKDILNFPLQAKYLKTDKAVNCSSLMGTSSFKTVNFSGITNDMDLNTDGQVTIGEIYQVANKILGGETVGTVTPSQIAGLAGAINEGFDECRIAKSFENAPVVSTSNLTAGISVKTYPNPFVSSFNIVFTSSANGDAKVDFFDESGRNLGVIYKNNVVAGMENTIEYKAPLNNPSVIFYRIAIGNDIVTGKALSQIIR